MEQIKSFRVGVTERDILDSLDRFKFFKEGLTVKSYRRVLVRERSNNLARQGIFVELGKRDDHAMCRMFSNNEIKVIIVREDIYILVERDGFLRMKTLRGWINWLKKNPNEWLTKNIESVLDNLYYSYTKYSVE